MKEAAREGTNLLLWSICSPGNFSCTTRFISYVDWMMDLSHYYGLWLTLIFWWLFAEDLVNHVIVLLLPKWHPSGSSKSWRIFKKILLLHVVQVCPPLGPPFLPNLNSLGLRSRHGKAKPLENFICHEKVRSWRNHRSINCHVSSILSISSSGASRFAVYVNIFPFPLLIIIYCVPGLIYLCIYFWHPWKIGLDRF